jgi:hypothetical protein
MNKSHKGADAFAARQSADGNRKNRRNGIGLLSIGVAGILLLANAGAAFAQGDISACIKSYQNTRMEVMKGASEVNECGRKLKSNDAREANMFFSQIMSYIKEEDQKETAERKQKGGMTMQNCQNHKSMFESMAPDVAQKKKFYCAPPKPAATPVVDKAAHDKAAAEKAAADKAAADKAAAAKAAADKAAADKAAADKVAADKAAADKAKAGAGGGAPAGLKKCADDGGTCTVNGPWTGKYGTSSKMVDIKGTGTFRCLPKGWAKPWDAVKQDTGADDPASGQAKACYLN